MLPGTLKRILGRHSEAVVPQRFIGALQIRDMTDDDVAQVAAIDADAFSSPWVEASFRNAVESENMYPIVAQLGDRVVGYSTFSVEGGCAHILNIAVHPKFRRRGVGFRLLKHLFALFDDLDIKEARLEVRESNLPAQLLYRKTGFKTARIRRNFYSSPTEDAVVMRWTKEQWSAKTFQWSTIGGQ